MTTIRMNTETYQTPDGEMVVFALVGDTYEAREIIKAAGLTYSDQVGQGKAWRSPMIAKSDMRPGNAAFAPVQAMMVNVKAALEAAGYTFARGN